MKELISQLLKEWIGQKVIGESEIKNLELAALEYLYISRENIKDINLVKEIEEEYLNGMTGKQAIIASNVLDDLIRKGIAKDPKEYQMKFYLLANGDNGDDLIIVDETRLVNFGITGEMAIHLDEVFASNGDGKITTWFKTKNGEQLATLFDVEKKCFDVVPF